MKCPKCNAIMKRLGCECYGEYGMYCTPERPGPGCPNGAYECPNGCDD